MLNRDCFRRCVRRRLKWWTWITSGTAATIGFLITLGALGFWPAFFVALGVFGATVALALLTCYFNCKI